MDADVARRPARAFLGTGLTARGSGVARGALLAPALLVAALASSLEAQSLRTEHTRAPDPGAAPPAASIADVAWLAGRWVGEGLGATVEETWLPPAGGAMAGVFRLVRDGKVDFYEIVTLAEEGGSLVLSLKHFGPDLVGWEEREASVRFPLVRRDEDTFWFDGLTIRRTGPDRMRIWVALDERGEEEREALFTYRRVSDSGTGPGAQEIDTLALESHARFLADDLLEGRGPASAGERLAALYLTTRLARTGLRPLPGRSDFRLPVPLTAVHVDGERAAVRLSGPRGTRTLRPPAFYHPGGGRAAFRDFGGPLLFAGATPGAAAALRGTEVTGGVVVLTPPWSGLAELEELLLDGGAAGAITLVPDSAFYGRLRIVRGPTRYFLPDGVRDPANQGALPALVGGPAMVRALGLEAEEVAPGSTLERVRPLEMEARVRLPHTTERRTGYNVAGYVPGADRALAGEWVVFVAHYDHVGYGQPTDGDSIWNGFVDNAVGCAMLLEIARALDRDPPARSVAFLFVTAEEQGLLGSNWFVHEPPIPLERIHAALNLDGGAPPAPPVAWGLVGADASEAGRTARGVIEGRGWSVRDVAFGPQSDHWPFHLAGVPTLMLFPGSELEGLTDERARALSERWLRPHTPDDEWSPAYPFAGIARYAELALDIGRTLAGTPTATDDEPTGEPPSEEGR